jgi:hypothetical protein
MTKLKEIMSLCKCGVFVSVNAHRDYYESVDENLDDRVDEIKPEVMKKMVETNTIIHIQAYPETPVGFNQVFHYDLDAALDEMLECLK